MLLRGLRLLLTAPQPPRLASLLASAEATGATSTELLACLIPSLLSPLLALVLVLLWWRPKLRCGPLRGCRRASAGRAVVVGHEKAAGAWPGSTVCFAARGGLATAVKP